MSPPPTLDRTFLSCCRLLLASNAGGNVALVLGHEQFHVGLSQVRVEHPTRHSSTLDVVVSKVAVSVGRDLENVCVEPEREREPELESESALESAPEPES